MPRRLPAAIALFLLGYAVATCAEERLDDVYAADRAFAARSAEAGAQAAFLEFLAPDAVLFRPTAVNGVEWLRTHEEATGRLDWSPMAGRVSCDGQLAVTVGPWTYRQDTLVATGYYLTVWRSTAQGGWQVVADHGIDSPAGAAPTTAASALFAWPEAPGGSCPGGGDARELVAANDRLGSAIHAQGLDASLRRFLATDAVVLRDEHLPARPAVDWPQDDRQLPAPLAAVTRGSYAAPGSDLGYTYGELASRGDRKEPGAVRAVFLRVWVRDRHDWRLLADLTTPVP